jgi:phospholipid/cholesterol/gamma-HCH transport system ATP-binding protein
MSVISLVNLHYQIDGQVILTDINLEFEKGETFVIMGPSGCGKSTLLRLIMGLVKPTAGWIEIDGINTSMLPKKDWQALRRKMGMVFQSAALFDSMTVFDNIAFGLRREKISEPIVKNRVFEALSIVGLDHSVAQKMPADLSGGMKKRTAIARAIAFEPPILLYDEPTTGLDPIIADTINDLICELQDRLEITSIVVTHDIISALKVADRVGLLYQTNLAEVKKRAELKHSEHPLMKEFLKNFQSAV